MSVTSLITVLVAEEMGLAELGHRFIRHNNLCGLTRKAFKPDLIHFMIVLDSRKIFKDTLCLDLKGGVTLLNVDSLLTY